MSAHVDEDFASSVRRRMADAGLTGATVVSAEPESGAFGDAIATLRVEGLLMRVVRDRGEEFLDIGCSEDPGTFFQYDDVEVALGWRTVEDLVSRQTPEPLDAVLERVGRRLPDLQAALSPGHAGRTLELVRAVEKERGEAFVARLRQR